MTPDLFTFTPEQREAAEAVARIMTERGIPMTADEAQLAANLGKLKHAHG